MKTAIVFVTFFCVQGALSGTMKVFDVDLERDHHIWKNICVPITGITPQMIENVKQGKFENIPEIKRYMACLWRVSGVMNEAGVVDMRLVRFYLPHGTTEEIDAYSSCNHKVLESEPDFVERVFQLVQCLYKSLSPHDKFIFF